ncbi:CD109 antigen-like [Littorina saxatilis]|uniref:CD109 antigen-like n=1 Tax=Littorina saxatilis TaxID=31220 RepID=UPI0038B51827
MMAGNVWTWVLSCFLLVTLTQGASPPKPAHDMTYWLSFSKYFRPGQTVEMKVWVCSATGPVTLSLDLMDYYGRNIQDGQNFTLQATDDVQTVQFKVSETFTSRYTYSSYIRARGFGGKVFDGFERVYIRTYDRLTVFIQTDKSVYTPGQKVKFRALAMMSDLTVSNKLVDISIRDPSNTNVAEWHNLTSGDDSGVVHGEMMTSNDPPLGTWWIRAIVDGVTETKKFKIAEVDEPQFDVRVKFDKGYALVSEDKLTATVVAKYLHGTPVQGSGFMNVTLSYYRPGRASVVRQFQLNDKGQAEVEFTKEELTDMAFNATYQWLAERYPRTYTTTYLASRRKTFTMNYRTLNFRAVVTDRVTEDMSAREKTLRFYTNPMVLRFIAPTPPSFKPDLPINVYVEAMTPDYKDRVENPNKYSVLYTMYYYRPWSTALDGSYSTRYSWQRPPSQKQVLRSKVVPLNSEGVAVWEIDCLSFPTDATYIVIHAKSGNVQTTKYVYKYTSPSKTYLQLRMKSPVAKVGKSVKIVATSNKDFGSFTYQVLAKNNVVQFKKVSKSSKSKKQEFSVDVTQDMYPAADVMVFFEAEGGEVVAEQLDLLVDGEFANELSLKFKKSEVKPGKKASLQVKGSSGSTVFLLGVDKAVKMLGKRNDITKDDLLTKLASLGGSGVYWRDGQIMFYSSSARDTYDVFYLHKTCVKL